MKGARSSLKDDTDNHVKKDVEMLMRDECFGKMSDCKCISLRLLVAKFEYDRRKLTGMVTLASSKHRKE